MSKKLSIITVNLNNSDGLEQTIQSVISQTFSNFEYIIIDGASTDGSVEVIKKYQEHFTYWVSEKDGGIYDAMNKGTAHATGEYCLYLNSGDLLCAPDTLFKVFNHSLQEDLVYGYPLLKDKNGKLTAGKKPTALIMVMYDYFLSHQSTFIKRELLQKLDGYRTDFKIAGDYDFMIRAIFKQGATYKYLDIPIALFSDDGVSSNPKNFDLGGEERKKSIQDAFPLLYIDLFRSIELEKVYKIPGIRFFMKQIYPLYHRANMLYLRKLHNF